MPNYICVTCGTSYPESDAPPEHCPICEDDRQYINRAGQQWTTLDALRAEHKNVLRDEEPGLTGIVTEPKVAIGQRVLLVRSPEGNVLWDCISYIDADTVHAINELGGIAAITISHPHFYSSMVDWSRAFGAPIYIHEANRPWVMRPDSAIRFWSGDTYELPGDMTIIRAGGHFPGSSALHIPGHDGRGVLLCGDTIMSVPDPRSVSFMYSFPNLIPLPPADVQGIVEAVEPFKFDRLYSGWFGAGVPTDANEVVRQSAERYIRMATGQAR